MKGVDTLGSCLAASAWGHRASGGSGERLSGVPAVYTVFTAESNRNASISPRKNTQRAYYRPENWLKQGSHAVHKKSPNSVPPKSGLRSSFCGW